MPPSTVSNLRRTLHQDPVQLWSQLKQEYCLYLKDKAKLRQLKKSNQKALDNLENSVKEYEQQKANLKKIELEKASTVKEVKVLKGTRDKYINDILKKSDSVMTDEEKETVRAVVLEEFKDELVRVLIEQVMPPDVPLSQKISCSEDLEWNYVITQFNFEETHELLKKLIQNTQGNIKKLLQKEDTLVQRLVKLKEARTSSKLTKEEIESFRSHPHLHVDLVEYLNPPKLEGPQQNTSNHKREVSKSSHKEEDIAVVNTYEDYLDLMDREMYNAWMIYKKRSEIYQKLSKYDQLVLVQSKHMKAQRTDNINVVAI
ncbi:hypothetical protein M8J75_010852 [Diaphorina citri]|nr:hypothetical protein M8J75_010852 [Diaphorina citri]